MAYAYDSDEFSRYYDKFVADHLSDDIYWINTSTSIYTDIIRRTLVNNQQNIIVELGCGTGENLIYFQDSLQNKNLQLIGIDHSQAMLNRAKEKTADQSNNQIEYICADLINFADCLEINQADCILLPAGTFHHLIADDDRLKLINNIQRTLRSETGLFVIYLMPDSFIYIEKPDDSDKQDRLRLMAVDNSQQTDNEWICKQTFEFDVPPKIKLSWQLRTCSPLKLIRLFISNNFELLLCCLNGKDLLPFDETMSSSLINNSTPVILVFRTIKSTD